MNILIYRNQLLQEVTTGAYFCDISNSTISRLCIEKGNFGNRTQRKMEEERKESPMNSWKLFLENRQRLSYASPFIIFILH